MGSKNKNRKTRQVFIIVIEIQNDDPDQASDGVDGETWSIKINFVLQLTGYAGRFNVLCGRENEIKADWKVFL